MTRLSVLLCLFIVLFPVLGIKQDAEKVAQQLIADSSKFSEEDMPKRLLKSYQTHFSIKRREQVAAAESIFEKPRYETRFNMLKLLLDEIFKQLRKSHRVLTSVELASLPVIPVEEPEVLDALIKVWENTAFFSDLILRMPDQVHLQFDEHPVRTQLIRWAVEDISYPSPVFDKTHHKQLDLLLQETGLAKSKDPSYFNPFAESYIRQKQIEAQEEERAQSELIMAALRRRIHRKPMWVDQNTLHY